MKVLYDHSVFSGQKVGGIPRYFSELIVRSENLHESQIATLYSDTVYLENTEIFRHILPFPRQQRSSWGRKMLKRALVKLGYPVPPTALEANKTATLQALAKGDFDVYHPTYYEDFVVENPTDKPLVLTVHDMIHEVNPELFPLNDDTFSRKAALIARAAKIIAVSESTRKELVKFYPSAAPKTEVVLHGPPFERVVDAERLLGLPERFVLFTGSRGAYKNFYFFVHGLARLMKDEPDLYLVCTGTAFQDAERNLFRMLEIHGRVIHRFATEKEMRSLYHTAECFVYPSYHEGFGFPVLEAFAAGCPAVLANASSLPEVGSDAATYFEPKDPESLLSALRSVLHDLSRREDLVARGFERLKDFSWQKTAQLTHEIYTSVERR